MTGGDKTEGVDVAEYREELHSVVAAIARSIAEAELIRMTLAAHGITATTAVPDPAHPSLNYVQGIQIFVAADQLDEALRILGEGNRQPR